MECLHQPRVKALKLGHRLSKGQKLDSSILRGWNFKTTYEEVPGHKGKFRKTANETDLISQTPKMALGLLSIGFLTAKLCK